MNLTSRPATEEDLDEVLALYRRAEKEQAALRPMWPLADGLAEPAEASLARILDDPDSLLVVGELDDVILGFAWVRSEHLLPQAGNERVAVVRLIYTADEARAVGIGDAMVTLIIDEMRRRGHRHFDARVSPGHRNAKNFFEAHGFSARRIVMYHDAADDE